MRSRRVGVPPSGLSFNLREFLVQGVEQSASRKKTVTVTFPTPVAEVRVRHGLGAKPKGFVIVNKSAAGQVFDSGTKWDRHFLYLLSDTPGITVTLEVI
jgi:hypothetical protein